jgi:hypothetical protein
VAVALVHVVWGWRGLKNQLDDLGRLQAHLLAYLQAI